ncbi:MAG: DeoR/GlpR family DNA-binding transcription regulator [Enterobacterales bacterium endosymbiont of Blomia tropicalis]|uniref:DeoR/GlpR family DNA-binding transcription regulator n=1 Tax=Mixta mediterraneensis TaxID=2758443 RepID=UPI0025A8F8ED|nr:DeoR/GlpR family DNA-binding transcription regulator [Mixta mediterraneensis]MDL4914496.1 DeoR/GlpR family DNA-binding transcription regulator [Mixta mediterraneensis]
MAQNLQENSLGVFMAETLPSDSRQARQLARRQLIAEAVMAEGAIRIEDITERFGISLMTAHRDIDEMVERGLLHKSRGVVSATPTSLVESSDIYRATRQLEEKQAIAEIAASYLETGQAIFLDDSTTVLQMARLLPAKAPLTVITNSLTLMSELKNVRDITLLGLGGQFHNWCNAFMGRMTRNEIASLRADMFFVSMSAIIDDTVFHQSAETVETKRAMFDAAQKRILMMDNTKFERRALHSFAHLNEFDAVIVNQGTAVPVLHRLQDLGVNVVVAPMKLPGVSRSMNDF